MFTLIGMLLMVIYSMNEAGKPENWAWMGFEKNSNSSGELNDTRASATHDAADSGSANKTTRTPAANSETKTAATPTTNSATTPNSVRSTPVRSEPIRLSESSPTFKRTKQPTALPTDSARFWSSFFANLSSAEQVEWMGVLEVLSSNQPTAKRAPATQSQTTLIARAQQRRDDFNNEMLDRMSSAPLASEKRSQVSEDYFEANKFWQQRISPALTAFLEAKDLTLVQQQAVVNLQHHLNIDALELVQDKTAIGWPGDSVAWKSSWNRIHQGKIGEPTFVKRIQLTGQPREFRGKAITVYGFVREIQNRRAASSDSIAGSQRNDSAEVDYYILWIQPSDSKAGPYCVYCLDLPPELPRTQAELAEFQQLATINGIFFKNRSYQAEDRSVQYCPLILTDGFELKPSLNWQLSPAWMAAGLALVPLLGVGIVWYAMRSTLSRKRLPSKKEQEEIDVFLGDLKNDPSIKTDLERVQAISEHDDDIS